MSQFMEECIISKKVSFLCVLMNLLPTYWTDMGLIRLKIASVMHAGPQQTNIMPISQGLCYAEKSKSADFQRSSILQV